MAKVISIEEAVGLIPDGATIMCGGFLGCGGAHRILDSLAKKGVNNLTIIANDSPPTGYSHSKLIDNKQVKKLIASHVGMNPNVASQMNSGEMEVVLIPQGSLVEMIRAGGAGLGGVLTPTGLGTMVAEGKQVVNIEGRDYLLEKPIRADFALLSGYKVDRMGNIWYKGTTKNFSPLMAMAADTVICEAEHLVEIGEIEPENVMTSGIFVDYIVNGGSL
ncbi:Acetate CoA-transferase subunit alpha [bioreactor metagenome]|uniref:Acetate CoA-transferase subunit alpha n=1 Tax=bioreactor metagenome TaxID=1076179 RepID=A0A644XFP8_9ZZZZ